MRLIDRLIFKDVIGPFLNGILMFLALLFAVTYLFKASEYLVKGVSLEVVAQMILFSMPRLLTQTFPMAMLLGGLLGMGRLSGDREAVAIFAAGVSFPRAIRIVVIMGALVSTVAFLWNDLVVPPCSDRANRVQRDVEKNLTGTDKPLSYPVEGSNGIEEFVTVDGGFDAKTHDYRRVTIIKYSRDPKRAGQPEVLIYCDHAKAGDLKGINWTYYDGYVIPLTPESDGSIQNFVVTNFEEMVSLPREASMGKRPDEILNAQRDDPDSKSFGALRQEIEVDRGKGMDTGGKEVDLYGKIALPIASLIFGIVGAALGLNTQRGGGKTVGFGVAVFIVLIYWIFYHAMFVVGKEGGLPPMLAAFLPNIVGAVVGAILTVRASK